MAATLRGEPFAICFVSVVESAEAGHLSLSLVRKYKDQGPSFQIDNPKSNLNAWYVALISTIL
jgi:hypothetical protein